MLGVPNDSSIHTLCRTCCCLARKTRLSTILLHVDAFHTHGCVIHRVISTLRSPRHFHFPIHEHSLGSVGRCAPRKFDVWIPRTCASGWRRGSVSSIDSFVSVLHSRSHCYDPIVRATPSGPFPPVVPPHPFLLFHREETPTGRSSDRWGASGTSSVCFFLSLFFSFVFTIGHDGTCAELRAASTAHASRVCACTRDGSSSGGCTCQEEERGRKRSQPSTWTWKKDDETRSDEATRGRRGRMSRPT